jgi:hypothetical protein
MTDALDLVMAEEPDPLKRYTALTFAQKVHAAAVVRVAEERGAVVAEMHDSGMSYAEIGELIGLSRARAQQLAERPTSRACDLRDTAL